MAFDDISVLSALRTAMSWRQTRQRILSENVANSDTVGFRPRDLKPLDPKRLAEGDRPAPALTAAVTAPGHIATRPAGGAAGTPDLIVGGFETTPDGNGVRLEEQMMKLTDNQLDYEMATTLYQRSLGLIRTAIRRS